jgi:hypothetical protein
VVVLLLGITCVPRTNSVVPSDDSAWEQEVRTRLAHWRRQRLVQHVAKETADVDADCCLVTVHEPVADSYYTLFDIPSLQATVNPCCAQLVRAKSLEGLVAVQVRMDGRLLMNTEANDSTGRWPLGNGEIFIQDITDKVESWGEMNSVGTHVLSVDVLFGESASMASTSLPMVFSYSQYGQDLWVLGLFGQTDWGQTADAPLFFLDIGAFHGLEISNTFVLETRGWHGICVDPMPMKQSFLQRTAWGGKGRHVLVRAAVDSTERHNVSFCTKLQPGSEEATSHAGHTRGDDESTRGVAGSMWTPGGGFAEFKSSESSSDQGPGVTCADLGYDQVQVSTRTIRSILAEHVESRGKGGASAGSKGPYCTISYMSLDTEGNGPRTKATTLRLKLWS